MTAATDPRALMAEVVGRLCGPGGEFEIAEQNVLGVPMPVFAHRERSRGERSPYNMLGYWNDPEATAATFDADRWMRTGDIGCVRAGLLYLTTRRSDLILRGGENVYPIEVEQVLDEHPAVDECAVVGAEHPDLGQEVCALVVLAPGASVTEAELAAFAAGRLAYYKVPTRWRISTDALPRNATGKVVRAGLHI